MLPCKVRDGTSLLVALYLYHLVYLVHLRLLIVHLQVLGVPVWLGLDRFERLSLALKEFSLLLSVIRFWF